MISGITSSPVAATDTASSAREKAALRTACEEVEGMFISLLLKEGLNPALEGSQESGGVHDNIRQYAIEQSARDLGRQGSFGISEFLYDELSVLL